MIENDEQLNTAQKAITNLQQVLLAARKTHNADEYKLMSEPILLEIQRREQEIIEYLSHIETEPSLTR
jgi:hypothetical protein